MVVSHQATLRVLYSYLVGGERRDAPKVEIPLHTLIKITWDGWRSIREERIAMEDFAVGLQDGQQCPSPGPPSVNSPKRFFPVASMASRGFHPCWLPGTPPKGRLFPGAARRRFRSLFYASVLQDASLRCAEAGLSSRSYQAQAVNL